MKKYKIILNALLMLVFISCNENRNGQDKSDLKVLDTITQIKVLKFGNAKSVVFPAIYMKKKTSSFTTTKMNYFSPDEQTIKDIETKLPQTSSLIYKMWGSSDEWMKYYKIDAKYMYLYDKQYFGYITSKKDSIIAIKIFNFETDPYKINENFESEIDFGACGWYNSNTCELAYSKKMEEFGLKFD